MKRGLFMRRMPVAALSAAAVIAAHGGPALLRSPAWQLAAAACALVACAAAALAARCAAAMTLAPLPSPFWLTAAALLAAQLVAHELLVLAAVHSGTGTPGTLALHMAVALIGAVLVHRGEARRMRRLQALAAALRGRLENVSAPLAPAAPTGAILRSAASPRAPPFCA